MTRITDLKLNNSIRPHFGTLRARRASEWILGLRGAKKGRGGEKGTERRAKKGRNEFPVSNSTIGSVPVGFHHFGLPQQFASSPFGSPASFPTGSRLK